MKKFLLTIVAVALPLLSFAQPNFGPRPPKPEGMTDEEFLQKQCREMANSIDLEGKQRKEFLEVYYEFRVQIDTLVKKAVKPCKPSKPEDMSEEEAEKMILGNFELTEQILQTRRDFYPKFKKVLNPSQILKMYFVENNKGRRGMGEQRRHDGPGKEAFPEPSPEQMP